MRMADGARRGVDGESGAAAVEFALVVPLFLLILAGIINFGIVITQQLVLNNAVREGARAAVVPSAAGGATCGQIVTKVRADISAPAMQQADVDDVDVFVIPQGFPQSSCGPGNPNTGVQPCVGSRSIIGPIGSIEVRAEWTSPFLFPWILPGIPETIDLRARAVYQCEYSF